MYKTCRHRLQQLGGLIIGKTVEPGCEKTVAQTLPMSLSLVGRFFAVFGHPFVSFWYTPSQSKAKITNDKHQISNKFQITMSKAQTMYKPTANLCSDLSDIDNLEGPFFKAMMAWHFEFDYCDLFVICFFLLEFEPIPMP